MAIVKNLAGYRFGRLVAIGLEPSKPHNATWLCLCDCGEMTVVRSDNLLNGHTKSCGCLMRERAKAHMAEEQCKKYIRPEYRPLMEE